MVIEAFWWLWYIFVAFLMQRTRVTTAPHQEQTWGQSTALQPKKARVFFLCRYYAPYFLTNKAECAVQEDAVVMNFSHNVTEGTAQGCDYSIWAKIVG